MLLLTCIAAACLLSLRQYRNELRGDVEDDLRSMADAKASEIAHWRDERLSAGHSIAAHPLVARAARDAQRGSAAARADLIAWCASRLKRSEYAAIVVLGPNGAPLAAAGAQAASAIYEAKVEHLSDGRHVTMSDIHRDVDGSVHIDVTAPLLATGASAPVAHALLRVDPEVHLGRVLQSWSQGPNTTPAFLVQRSGDDVFVFGPEQPASDATTFFAVSIDRRDLAIARAAAGEQGAIEGVDTRGTRVLAGARQVPGTGWSVVAQVNASEVDDLVRARALWLAMLGGALTAVVAAVAQLWWRRQLDAFRRGEHEHELRRLALERHFAYLTQYANDVLMLLDDDLRIVEVNDRCVSAYGYERDELLGRRVRDVLGPRARDGLVARMSAAETGEGQIFEAMHLRRDGSAFPVEVSARIIEVDGERYYQQVIRDITERKQAERTIRDNEERLHLALETSGLGIWDWNVERDDVYVSPTLLDMLGYPAGGLQSGEAIRRILHPEDRAATAQRWRALLDGTAPLFEAEMRLRSAAGEWKCVLNRARMIRRGGGAGTRVIGTFGDLTERKAIQARLEFADRISSLGTLAAGVAHEINNPLACLVSGLEFGRESIARITASSALAPLLAAGDRDAPGSVTCLLDETRMALDDAQQACEQLQSVARNLTSFSRSDGATRLLDVRQVLESAVGLARGTLHARARLARNMAQVPPVEASPTRLRQVFLNILLNAVQAIPEGAAERNEIGISTGLDRSGRVVVEIRDTGSGMSPDVQARIFDPFFTTKTAGAGTGLGLWICHDIVTGLGGEILVESAPGRGAVFRVLLAPSSRAEAHARGAEPDRAADPRPP